MEYRGIQYDIKKGMGRDNGSGLSTPTFRYARCACEHREKVVQLMAAVRGFERRW